MFFEYNTPTSAPNYLPNDVQTKLNSVLRRIADRMNKLENALILTGLRGEVFAEAAKFFMSLDASGNPVMDSMDETDLASAVTQIARGIDATTIPERLEFPNCNTFVDAKFLTNGEWELVRMLGIGGSDSACVQNDGYSSAREIWADKRGISHKKVDTELRYIFDYGHTVEDLVVDTFCRRYGAKRYHETRMFQHKDYPFILANVDDFVKIDATGELFTFEAKTTTVHNRDLWKDGKAPRQYIYQCIKYPLVVNDDRIKGTFIGCIYGNTPNDFVASRIYDRDEEREKEQLDIEVQFWKNYVETGIEPPLSNTIPIAGDEMYDLRYASNKIQSINKNKDAKEIPFDEDLELLLQQYVDAQEKEAQYKKQAENQNFTRQALQAKILEYMDPATNSVNTMVAPNSFGGKKTYTFSYRPRSSTKVDKEKLQMEFPDAYRICVTVNPEGSRVFSVKVR